MAGWDFPTALDVGGQLWRIRKKGDFRLVLDVIEILADDTITNEERGCVSLSVFFRDYPVMEMDEPTNRQAIKQMLRFVGGGKTERRSGAPQPRLMDWNQDFPLLVSPINHVLGYECRSAKYVHWWTFLAAYMEIGECYFQQVVAIRSKKSKHQKLDKADQQFYDKHRDDIDLRRLVTDDDMAAIRQFLDQ